METITIPACHSPLMRKWKSYSVTQNTIMRFILFLTVFFTTTSFGYKDPGKSPDTKNKTGINKKLYAGGDFSLDFVAAGPFTYSHLDDAVSSGGQYGSRVISKTSGVVESLEGGDFKCGDWVIFLTAITVDPDAVDANQTIELDYSFLANSTGQAGAALCEFGNVTVNTGDPAMIGTASATLNSGAGIKGTIFTPGAKLQGTVTITGLDAGEVIIVRVPVKICCDPGSSPTGNLQGAILAGRVKAPGTGTINVGNQTIPFKKIGELQTVECSITPRDAVCSGTTNAYTATSTQAGATFDWTISGNGTFLGGGTTFSETPAGTTSTVSVVAGAAGTYTLGITISKEGFQTTTCSQTITVNANPDAPGVKNTAFCVTPGAVTQLLDNITSGTPIFTDASGTPLDPQPSTQSLGTAGTFTYYVIQESLGGCRSGVVSFTITVYDNPVLVVKPISNVCPATTADLTTAIDQANSTLPVGTTFKYYESDGTTEVATPGAVGAGTYYIEASTNTTPACTDREAVTVTINRCNEGCTPGYWKNRKASWNTIVTYNDLLNCVNTAAGTSITGEMKTTLFQTVFGLTDDQMKLLDGVKNPGNLTLLSALSLGDGSGFTQLARAATAALLNACSGMYYPYTSSQIIAETKAVFASGNRADAIELAKKYDIANNAGCTLTNGGKQPAITVFVRPTGQQGSVSELNVKASPNPYNDKIRFTIQAPKAGRATLEVFNMLGQKVGVPFEGQLRANETRNVEYTVPVNYRSSLIYMLRMNGEQLSGKLMSTRQ
jgi:hypothetical protein